MINEVLIIKMFLVAVGVLCGWLYISWNSTLVLYDKLSKDNENLYLGYQHAEYNRKEAVKELNRVRRVMSDINNLLDHE